MPMNNSRELYYIVIASCIVSTVITFVLGNAGRESVFVVWTMLLAVTNALLLVCSYLKELVELGRKNNE